MAPNALGERNEAKQSEANANDDEQLGRGTRVSLVLIASVQRGERKNALAVETENQVIWEQYEQARNENGLEDEDKEKSEDELKGEYNKIAVRRVRLGLLLAEIGRINNIEVSAEEVNQAMLQEVRKYPGQERQVMEYFQMKLLYP